MEQCANPADRLGEGKNSHHQAHACTRTLRQGEVMPRVSDPQCLLSPGCGLGSDALTAELTHQQPLTAPGRTGPAFQNDLSDLVIFLCNMDIFFLTKASRLSLAFPVCPSLLVKTGTVGRWHPSSRAEQRSEMLPLCLKLCA